MRRINILRIKLFVTFFIIFTLVGCTDSEDQPNFEDASKSSVHDTETKRSVKDSLKGVTLNIVTSGLIAPFSYYDVDGKTLIGFDLDLLYALQELLGFEIEHEIQAMDYTALTAAIADNNYDLAIAALCATDSRKEVMHFSKTYYESGQMIVINKNSSPEDISVIEDFKEKEYTIGIEKSTASHSYCIAKEIPESRLIIHDEITTVYESLEQGMIDACIQDTPGIAYYIKTNPSTKLAMVGREFNQGQASYALALSFEICKQNPKIPVIIDMAIDELIDNGTMDKIKALWCK